MWYLSIFRVLVFAAPEGPSSLSKTMDATLNALGQLLIQALPTFFLVLLLHFYLKSVFFEPLGRVLAERKEATEGAREKAAEALARANAKAAQYEEQIRVARADLYRDQEEQRRLWRDEQAAQIVDARRRADEAITAAKAQLTAQAEEMKGQLGAQTESLAQRITESVLQGKAA